MESFLNRYDPSTPLDKLPSDSPILGDGVTSFSGADLTAYIFLPGLYPDKKADPNKKDIVHEKYTQESYRKLGSLKFISWSSTRAKVMVTSLGKSTGTGFTRGIRVITGVMVFNQLNKSAFYPLNNRDFKTNSYHGPYRYTTSPDELPPFNILLSYVNEAGHASFMTLNGVEMVQTQGTNSIDEVVSSVSYSFVALGMSELISLTADRVAPKDLPESGQFSIGESSRIITKGNGERSSFNVISPPIMTTLEDLYSPLSKSPGSVSSTISNSSVGNVIPPAGKNFPDVS